MKKKLVQILTIVVLAACLVCFFLPAVQDYENAYSLWGRAMQAYSAKGTSDVLINCLYFVPTFIAALLVALLDGKFRYAAALFASCMGLTLTLSQFILPAFSQSYLFSVYQPGLYLLLLFQVFSVFFSVTGICLKQSPEELLALSATAELDLKAINERLKKEREKERKKRSNRYH